MCSIITISITLILFLWEHVLYIHISYKTYILNVVSVVVIH